MPLTALLDRNLVDASVGDDDLWARIYKTRPRTQLLCRGCGGSVHAKISSRALRFFCHDRTQPACPSNGETPEHLLLKAVVAQIIRDYGWTAEVEAYPSNDDRGGWRADVLATSPDRKRRVAFEAQQSPMTGVVGRERTQRYCEDGVEVLWVTLNHPGWLFSIPGIHVEATRLDLSPESPVTRGLARLNGRWEWTSKDTSLRATVGAVLGKELVVHELSAIIEDVAHPSTDSLYHRNATVWVSPREIESFQIHTQLVAAARLEKEADQRQRAQNITALYARQSALLPAVVSLAEAEIEGDEHVWLGVPATRLSFVGQEATLEAALGNEKTAMGAVVWLGPTKDTLRLFAVISPVASRIGFGLARSWGARRVRVFAQETAELRRLTDALGWTATLVTPAQAAAAKIAREVGYEAVKEQRRAAAVAEQQLNRSMSSWRPVDIPATATSTHEDLTGSTDAALLLRAVRDARAACHPEEVVLIGNLGTGLLECGATGDDVTRSYIKKSLDLTGTKVFISTGGQKKRLFGLVAPMLGQYAGGPRKLLESGVVIYVGSAKLAEAADLLHCAPGDLRTEVD